VIFQCSCGFATDDPLWYMAHQGQHALKRPHDVRGLTLGELERIRRELRASLALVRAGSPARVPILARMDAIDAELAERAILDGRVDPG
jgi:hypothetical protein